MKMNGGVEWRIVLQVYHHVIALIYLKFRTRELIVDKEYVSSVSIWCACPPGHCQIEGTRARTARIAWTARTARWARRTWRTWRTRRAWGSRWAAGVAV